MRVVRYKGALSNFLWSLLNTFTNKFYSCRDRDSFIFKPRGFFPWGFHEPEEMRKELLDKKTMYVVFTPGPQVRTVLRDISKITERILMFGKLYRPSLTNKAYISNMYETWWPYVRDKKWRDVHFIIPICFFIDIEQVLEQLKMNNWDVHKTYKYYQTKKLQNSMIELEVQKAPEITSFKSVGEKGAKHFEYYEIDVDKLISNIWKPSQIFSIAVSYTHLTLPTTERV